MPRNKEFAHRLKQLRAACGLTQKSIAEVLGMDRSTYAYYETGKTYPDLDTLTRLAGIFRVSADTLLGRRPATVEVHDTPLPFVEDIVHRFEELTVDERILVLQYRQLTDDQRTAVAEQLHRHLNDPEKED